MSLKAKKFTADPRYWGPGVWFGIHMDAWDAIDDDKRRHFYTSVRRRSETIPCRDCRIHAQAYIARNPPEDALVKENENRDVGAFLWSVQFHNAVNVRLKKRPMPPKQAIELYKSISNGEGVCVENCGVDGAIDTKIRRPVELARRPEEIRMGVPENSLIEGLMKWR